MSFIAVYNVPLYPIQPVPILYKVLWGKHLNASKGDKIQKFQNQALRICGLSGRYVWILTLHQQFNVLPIALRCRLDIMILMFKKVHCSVSPNHESKLLATQTRLYSGPTRCTPRPKLKPISKFFLIFGPQNLALLTGFCQNIKEAGPLPY